MNERTNDLKKYAHADLIHRKTDMSHGNNKPVLKQKYLSHILTDHFALYPLQNRKRLFIIVISHLEESLITGVRNFTNEVVVRREQYFSSALINNGNHRHVWWLPHISSCTDCLTLKLLSWPLFGTYIDEQIGYKTIKCDYRIDGCGLKQTATRQEQ